MVKMEKSNFCGTPFQTSLDEVRQAA